MNRKEQIIRLWRACFHDTEAFIHLFFDEIYREENVLTIEQQGMVIAALQMLPYEMMWLGIRIRVSYVYGACTDEQWRNKGWMSQLLQQAFEVMRQRGVALTVLIPAEPWLFNYYARQGYLTLFHYAERQAQRSSQPTYLGDWQIEQVKAEMLPQLYPSFDQLMASREASMLHSYADFTALFTDTKAHGGEWLVARNRQQQPQGFLFLSPSDEGMAAPELIAANEAVGQQLLQEAMQRHQQQSITYLAPPRSGNCHPLGMARLISPAPLLDHWIKKHPESSLTLAELEALSPDALTRLLFCSEGATPYMSLMMN